MAAAQEQRLAYTLYSIEIRMIRKECQGRIKQNRGEGEARPVQQIRPYSPFHLRMRTEITSLIEDQDRIVGIRGNTPAGPAEIRANLVAARMAATQWCGHAPA